MFPQPPATVLDFGAGEGHLVRALRDAGIDAHGVEPSPAARANAAREQGVELVASVGDLATRQFDAVTMLHSLEHVEDPLATLRELRELLRPGASLYIEVPHAGSADMLIGRSRRAILDLPVHLHHFTPRTLTHVVEQARCSIVATHRFNALPVEAAIRLRAGRRSSQTAAAARNPSQLSATAGARAAGDGERLMAMVRRVLPGWKFWVVARADGDSARPPRDRRAPHAPP
ncbi:MAG: class I SAM-dependent methyltransferase [Solirubrobacteraceae bacterium]